MVNVIAPIFSRATIVRIAQSVLPVKAVTRAQSGLPVIIASSVPADNNSRLFSPQKNKMLK